MNRLDRGIKPVELAVLIAIIVLTAAVLYPVWERMQTHSPSPDMQCMSYTKQVVIALKTYTDDCDGKLPFLGTDTPTGWKPRMDKIKLEGQPPRLVVWPVILDPYLKTLAILACPIAGSSEKEPFSYFFNRRLSGLRERAVRHPENCIMLGDWVPYGYDSPRKSTTWDIARSKQSLPRGSWEAGKRHAEGALYGFADGHVRWYKLSDIVPSPGGRKFKPDPKRPSFIP